MLFERLHGNDFDVYVADLQGTMHPLAARVGDVELNSAWSPDGEWVAYVLIKGTGVFTSSDLRLVRADGSQDRSLLNDGGTYLSPTWSPDGRYLAFGCWRGMEDGICYLQMPEATFYGRAPAAVRTAQNLSWSPDGSRIAFEDFNGRQSIQILRVVGGDLVPAVVGPVSFGPPEWSPDGKRLSVAVTEDGAFGQYVVNADGTNPRALASKGVRWAGGWSPDGARIAIGFVPEAIHLISPDSAYSRVLLTSNASPVAGAWRPDRPSAARAVAAPRAAGAAEGPPPTCRVRVHSRRMGDVDVECDREGSR